MFQGTAEISKFRESFFETDQSHCAYFEGCPDIAVQDCFG